MANKKVLLVEDDEAIAELIKDYLSDVCDIDYVAKASDALKKAKMNSYSVIVTDNTLPDMEGIKLAAEIMKDKPNSTIVMMTGSENPEIKKRAMEVGIKSYIVKDTAITFLEQLANIIKKNS